MVITAPYLSRPLQAPVAIHAQQPKQVQLEQSWFLQAVIEGFVDGILIVTAQGEWVHANERARTLCQQLAQPCSRSAVPKPIWRVCTALLESQSLFPDRPIILESEIIMESGAVLRVRVRWLDLADLEQPYLLITLEDQRQSAQELAIAEIAEYQLTPREAEVWSLRRAQYSYKEIAAKLYITQNTVKKHLSSIRAKQQALL